MVRRGLVDRGVLDEKILSFGVSGYFRFAVIGDMVLERVQPEPLRHLLEETVG